MQLQQLNQQQYAMSQYGNTTFPQNVPMLNNLQQQPPQCSNFQKYQYPKVLNFNQPGFNGGMMPNLLIQQPLQNQFVNNMLMQPNGMMPQQQQLQAQPVKQKQETWRKLFVNNIHEDVPDDFIEQLLTQCGAITQWKRNKDEKGKSLKFGYVEFQQVEGVLKCIRLLNDFAINNSKLLLKPDQKTEMFLEQWKDLKRKEWLIKSVEEKKGFQSFESFLQKDDEEVKQNIQNMMIKLEETINKVKHQKEVEEEKKEHPRERDRDYRRRKQKQDIERRGKDSLNDWLRQEEDKKRQKKKDREREEDKQKLKQRLLDKELSIDSEEEKKFKNKYKSNQSRIKFRQKEMDEDEMERKKELLKFVPQEPEINIDQLKPQGPEGTEIGLIQNTEMEIEQKKPATVKQPSFVVMTQELNKRDFQDNQPLQGSSSLQLNFAQQATQQKQTSINNVIHQPNFNIFGDDNDNDEIVQKKQKLNLPKIGNMEKRTKQNEIELQQQQQAEQLQLQQQQQQLQQQQEQQSKLISAENLNTDQQKNEGEQSENEDGQKNSEQLKEELKNLIKLIPTKQKELFSYEIKWALLAKTDVFEKKVRPWLVKKSYEYLKEEEINFIKMIIKKLQNQESAQNILKKVEIILDEDAEEFVRQLWRMLIFEMLKAERDIV